MTVEREWGMGWVLPAGPPPAPVLPDGGEIALELAMRVAWDAHTAVRHESHTGQVAES